MDYKHLVRDINILSNLIIHIKLYYAQFAHEDTVQTISNSPMVP